MDYAKMLDEALKKAMFNMENDMYNNMLADAMADKDMEEYMKIQAIIAAFNRRGVSTKIVIEALKEAAGGAADE